MKTAKLAANLKLKVLTNVGTFFYDNYKSESHFIALDSELFFITLQSAPTTTQQLAEILFAEFDLTLQECIQITQDTLDLLHSKHLLDFNHVET